jgi:hypothetical protein
MRYVTPGGFADFVADTSVPTAVRLLTSAGLFTSGMVSLYGVIK